MSENNDTHRKDSVVPVLTGPAAAAVYGWDGYRDLDWPLLWCVQHSQSRPVKGVIRTRLPIQPRLIGNQLVAHPRIVLRHLNALSNDSAYWRPDGIKRTDRIELGLEHALRDKVVTLAELKGAGGTQNGAHYLRQLLLWRGDEPATESFGETRLLPILRETGRPVWRQVRIFESGRIKYRCDFVLGYLDRPRPTVVLPHHGLLVESDSLKYHNLIDDHQRQLTYNLLGYNWMSVMATQVEDSPRLVLASILAALERALRSAA
jgi:very-short-patch-repair endonuclease